MLFEIKKRIPANCWKMSYYVYYLDLPIFTIGSGSKDNTLSYTIDESTNELSATYSYSYRDMRMKCEYDIDIPEDVDISSVRTNNFGNTSSMSFRMNHKNYNEWKLATIGLSTACMMNDTDIIHTQISTLRNICPPESDIIDIIITETNICKDIAYEITEKMQTHVFKQSLINAVYYTLSAHSIAGVEVHKILTGLNILKADDYKEMVSQGLFLGEHQMSNKDISKFYCINTGRGNRYVFRHLAEYFKVSEEEINKIVSRSNYTGGYLPFL